MKSVIKMRKNIPLNESTEHMPENASVEQLTNEKGQYPKFDRRNHSVIMKNNSMVELYNDSQVAKIAKPSRNLRNSINGGHWETQIEGEKRPLGNQI